MQSIGSGLGKPEIVTILVKNAESSTALKSSDPVVFAFNGTDDGLAVVLPITAGAAQSKAHLAGICTDNIAVGKQGRCVVYGFYRTARLQRGTRAATTDAWPTLAAVALGDYFVAETVNNNFEAAAAGTATSYNVGVAAAQTLASAATAASSNTGAAYKANSKNTALTVAVKTFVRLC